jgi:hypothetical protein
VFPERSPDVVEPQKQKCAESRTSSRSCIDEAGLNICQKKNKQQSDKYYLRLTKQRCERAQSIVLITRELFESHLVRAQV